MPGPMDEAISESCLLDHVSRSPVDRLGLHPWAHCGDGRRVGFGNDPMNLGIAVWRIAHHDVAGDVGAIAVQPSPEVEDHCITQLHFSQSRFVMR